MDEDEIDEIDGDIFTYAATNNNRNEAKIIHKVLHNIKSRFKSRLTLQETINSLICILKGGFTINNSNS